MATLRLPPVAGGNRANGITENKQEALVGDATRTRLLPESATYRLPKLSTKTPVGVDNYALVAAPLSPL